MGLKLSTANAVGRNGGSAVSETPRGKGQKHGSVSRGVSYKVQPSKAKKLG